MVYLWFPKDSIGEFLS